LRWLGRDIAVPAVARKKREKKRSEGGKEKRKKKSEEKERREVNGGLDSISRISTSEPWQLCDLSLLGYVT